MSQSASEDSIVMLESEDEHDQLLSDSLQTAREPSAVNFTFINEFASNDSEELVVDNPRPTKATNKPQIGRKRKVDAPSAGEDEGDQPQVPNSKSKGVKAKKAKTSRGLRNKLAVFESDDEDHQPQSLSVRAYLHLETTSQQPGRSKKSNTVTVTKSTQCNPFIFTIDSSFKAFVRDIASAAKTTTSNLTLSRLRWKFETPASLPMKLLTDEVGFRAMIDAVQERTKGHTIFLYLPKPIDLEGPPEESSRCNVRYEYDEDSTVPPECNVAVSHKAQINALREESTKEVMELERRYPIGSHPLFLNKRIYARNGLFWELSSLRLNVWGAAIRQSTQSDPRATYDMPPVSNYFTKDKAIKPARPPPDSSMTVFAAYGAYAKGKDYTPESHGGSGLHTASTDYENSMPSRSGPDPSFFMHQLPHAPPPPSYYHPPYYPYQYSYYPPPNAVHPPTAPPHPSLAPSGPLPATSSITDSYPSPGITTKHSVTLEAFCTKFIVSASDSEKLSKLGYDPGNQIVESLTTDDWQSVGFTVLSWRTFLSYHRKFCDAIIAGTWISPA